MVRKLHKTLTQSPAGSHCAVMPQRTQRRNLSQESINIVGRDIMRKPHNNSKALLINDRGADIRQYKLPARRSILAKGFEGIAKSITHRPIINFRNKTADKCKSLFTRRSRISNNQAFKQQFFIRFGCKLRQSISPISFCQRLSKSSQLRCANAQYGARKSRQQTGRKLS